MRLFATFAIAVCIGLVCLAAPQVSKQKKFPDLRPLNLPAGPMAPRLSQAQKLQVLKSKGVSQVNGLANFAEVRIDKPEDGTKGYLWMGDVADYNGASNSASVRGSVGVFLNVIHPGKLHLVSFYTSCFKDQKYLVRAMHIGDSDYLLHQEQTVPRGSQVISCVVTPKRAGEMLVALTPETESLRFYRIEASVVN